MDADTPVTMDADTPVTMDAQTSIKIPFSLARPMLRLLWTLRFYICKARQKMIAVDELILTTNQAIENEILAQGGYEIVAQGGQSHSAHEQLDF